MTTPQWSAIASLLLLGQLQGWMLAFALLGRARPGTSAHATASRWLAGLLICLTVTLNVPLLQELNIWLQWPRTVLLLSGLPFLFGPLLLAHVAAQTHQPSWLAPRWLLLHALLPLGFYVLLLPLLLRGDGELQQMLSVPTTSQTRFSLLPTLKHLSFVGYSIASLYLLYRYEFRLRDQLAELAPYALRWLRALVWSALVLVLVLALLWLTGWSEGQHDRLLALALTVLIVAAGVHGLRRTPVFVGSLPVSTTAPVPTPEPTPTSTPATADSAVAAGSMTSTTRPLLATAELQALQTRLDTLADNESLLFDYDLTLDKLASALKVSPHQLSWALNQIRGQRFYDFINGLRVLKVQQRLRDSTYANQPILDIALGCGFANKTTFNKAFKQNTGVTPSEWRRTAAS